MTGLKEISKSLKVKYTTLKDRINKAGIKPDRFEFVNGNLRKALFGKAKLRKIINLIKSNPVGSQMGRPAMKKRR